eukprot:5231805-Prymnesium_polylepis.2
MARVGRLRVLGRTLTRFGLVFGTRRVWASGEGGRMGWRSFRGHPAPAHCFASTVVLAVDYATFEAIYDSSLRTCASKFFQCGR